MGRLGKRAQIAPEAIGIAVAEERFNFFVSALPRWNRGSEQVSPLCGERHQPAAPVSRVGSNLYKFAAL